LIKLNSSISNYLPIIIYIKISLEIYFICELPFERIEKGLSKPVKNVYSPNKSPAFFSSTTVINGYLAK
jgi:hypothetical protein